MKLAFVTSKRNFSDILTRHLDIRTPNPNLFQTPRSVSTNLEDYIPETIFNLESWSKFVNSNPQLLTYDEKKHIKLSILKQKKDVELVNNVGHINILTSSKIAKIHLEQSIQNLTNYITEPLNVLETYLTTNQIVDQQRLEYDSIYDKLRTSEDNVTTIDRVDYKLDKKGFVLKYPEGHPEEGNPIPDEGFVKKGLSERLFIDPRVRLAWLLPSNDTFDVFSTERCKPRFSESYTGHDSSGPSVLLRG